MLYNPMSLMATMCSRDAIVLPGTPLRCIDPASMRHGDVLLRTHAVSGRMIRILFSVRHQMVPFFCHPMHIRAAFIGARQKRTTGDKIE